MSISPISEFLQNIRRAALRRDEAGWTDGQLLDVYVHSREEEAFAALLHRHGPMVWGVCRRVLGNEGDAEDAFQATFLVLVRKAASIVPREQIANWLYGVARQTAVKARAMAVRRMAREKLVKDMPEVAAEEQNGLDDWLPLLDQVLGRLPEKYRTAIVLCDLQGKSYKEAAGELGCPEGTLAARLARGRAMLSKRLARQGFIVTSAVLAAVLSQSASASTPASVVSSTIKAATLLAVGRAAASGAISVQVAALTEGVLKAMLLSKLKLATTLMVTVGTLSGAAGLLYFAQAGEKAPRSETPAAERGIATPAPAAENILLNGGFEKGDDSPEHWSQGAEIEGVQYIWDKKKGQRGKASICLHKTAQRYFPIAQWYQEVDRKGDKAAIHVAAQVKTERVTKAIIDVIFLDEKGKQIGHQWAAYIGAQQANDPPANHDWKEYTGQVEILQAAKKIRIALQIYGPGKVWFDEVRAEYTDAQAEKPRAEAGTKPTPPALHNPVDKEAWARKLVALNEADWRVAFAIGQDLAALPADEGFTILQENWQKVTRIEARQQFLKAWYWTLTVPGTGPHPRLLDVMDLGVRDRSPEVQTWAFNNVRDISFQEFAEDFDAYKAWHQANRLKPVPQVIAESAKRLVNQAAKAQGKEASTLAKSLNERTRMFSVLPGARRAALDAGLLGILERWVAGAQRGKHQNDSELAKQALNVIATLKPDEAYLRRVVVPLLAGDKPAELRTSALLALRDERNAWAFDLVLDLLKNSLQDDERNFPLTVWSAAQTLAEIGNPKAIPVMIGVIEADDTYNTVYGVGYFGLSPLTGVRYDESHKGAWWRKWWDKNKERFPTARHLEIPKLTKNKVSKNGKRSEPSADVADVPALDLRAGGDTNKRYFLIGFREGAEPPAGGYGLLIVVPGGDGSAKFHPFVRDIYKNVLNERWLIAQAVAPEWDDKQFDQVVWPREGLRYAAAKFTTEEFLEAVLTDVKAKTRVDAKRVFLLGWSSGGPPCYSLALRKGSPVSGAFIAMSVFKLDQMPALENAKGKAFYLLQSSEDNVTPIRFAVAAEKALREAGGDVRLQRYEGGHGWQGDVWQNIGNGLTWLEQRVSR
jgi:RNA polymerase sigma factor (sigma-70 family)